MSYFTFTKTYSDEHRCEKCQRIFTWIYIDDGYRPWKKNQYSPSFFSYGTNEEIKRRNLAICKHRIEIPNKSEFFDTNCPFCGHPFSYECTDNILKDFYS